MKKLSFLQIIMLVCCIAIFSFEAHAVEDTLEPLSGKADLQAPDPPSDEGQATQGTAGPDHIPDRIRDIRTRADRAAAAASDNIIPKPQARNRNQKARRNRKARMSGRTGAAPETMNAPKDIIVMPQAWDSSWFAKQVKEKGIVVSSPMDVGRMIFLMMRNVRNIANNRDPGAID